MKYWDSSAIVPLLVRQKLSARSMAIMRSDAQAATWWGTEIECASALARLGREGLAAAEEIEDAFDRLSTLSAGWNIVQPAERVKPLAIRLLRTHNLRAGDALQLASAIEASGGKPGTLEFVCFDERLSGAARKEGFRVLS
jgi:predicted nucleic acid-binding protein